MIQACKDLPGDLDGFVKYSEIARQTGIRLADVRVCLKILGSNGWVALARLESGYKVHIEPEGELALSQEEPFLDKPERESAASNTIKIVPKGLRSFDAEDKDFFLELLPGPRRGDGLPESVHFWKVRIEEMDPDKTFRVGYIFGPSGCGKSSLVKAGLLPRLSKPIISIYIEATGEETEARLLRGLRKQYPDLPADLDLRTALVAARDKIREGSTKILLVIDQFEQWYHAKGAEPGTELAKALSECDGGRVQAILLVRDDYSMALHRFMAVIGVRQNQDQNFAVVDLFDLQHARKVLIAFGRGYGMLPDDPKEMTGAQNEFLDRTIKGLSQEGRVVSVRLALFAEMLKGKPWTPETFKQVGGAEGVGVTFLEETFSARTAPPSYRIHQKAAQAVLRALLPEAGSNIKGNMRSYDELRAVSGYGSRPNEFDELLRILNVELRLISPIEPEGSESDGQTKTPVGEKFFLLTHDYLVPSIREWLTRKQKETRRGRAELRLVERSSLWNAKPENRHLPSLLEWANIGLLTRKTDWTDPQRKMMKRAGRVHGVRGLVALLLLVGVTFTGLTIRHSVIENNKATYATGLVQQLLRAEIAQVPEVVRAMLNYRRWTDPELKRTIGDAPDDSGQRLHASLALLPVDSSQLPFLEKHLLDATPAELPVIRDFLKPHRSTLVPKLWSVLDSAKPGEVSVLPAASALADYDTTSPHWEVMGNKVAQALVSVNPVYLGDWLDALRPVRDKLTTPLAAIFRDRKSPESERNLATNILNDYASDDPDRLAELLMVSDPKAYLSFFPIAERQAVKTLPLFQAELAKQATYSWNDPPLDPTWAKPDVSLVSRIESARGILAERFAFCQMMPLDEFLTTAEGLRPSGYRPTRFRPYAEGKSLRVAAVWVRDSRPWRLAHDQSTETVRQTDERNCKEGYLPVEVAGYLSAGGDDGKPTSHFTALWAQRTRPDDDARMVVASSAAERTKAQEQLKDAGLVPLTLHAWRQADDKLSYSGVWHKTATGTSDTANGLSEAVLPSKVARQAGSLIDLDLTAAPPPPSTKERAASALQVAEAAFKAKPDDLNARFARASAHFQQGENQKAIDDLNKALHLPSAYKFRAIAHARLGHKDEARFDLERFQKGNATERQKLYLAVIVAAELGEGTDKALETLEEALKKQPQDSMLHYDAACACALASQALAGKDQAKGRELAERAIPLLRRAIENGYADYKHMQEDTDIDPLREIPTFVEIMKAGHLDRSYAAVWTGDVRFEAIPLYGLDLVAHLQRCRELVSQGYRMVALTVAQTSPQGPSIAASVWHRPVITEETRDQLAERQARAAIALFRMGKAEEVWPLLRHSADPRLRSFIINWLSLLGADSKTLAAELDRIPATARPTPVQGQQFMDAILFHPETSMRRALILALGTYGTEGLSPGEREPLINKLLDLYRNDPDSGIHGAAEWTLRQWKQQEKLKELDAELMKLKDWGERRWYVNGQGQTFAVIEGPVEFRMGSPPTDTERFAGNEPPRRMAIPRRVAIAAKEVTVEQFQRFLKLGGITIDRYQLSASDLSRYSPDPQGPWIAPDWYTAAHYCNWLSEQEGLPKDQWCYLPNEAGAYAEGMSIPADVLERTGYRLPTEAEWEFTCRAGAVTSRYYGHSLDLLDAYARYQANSKDHAWRCGSLFPNDLGLFDMLGNMYEWCQDSVNASKPAKKGICNDLINISESIVEKNPRLLRGGSFVNQPAIVRSAIRDRYAPAYRNYYKGFRPSRTYH